MPAVDADREVSLGGTAFPLRGPVRVQNISVTPNPVLFGDTSKQGDSQVMSQLIQSSNTGGSGVYKANPRTDTDRVWKSRAETRYRGILCLPPLVTSMGAPAGVTANCTMSIEFGSSQYFAFGNVIYRWNDASSTWTAALHTPSTSPTDAIVYNGYLIVAWTTGYSYTTDGVAWTTKTTPCSYFAIWDNKLWKLGLDGTPGVWTIAWNDDPTDLPGWTTAAAPADRLPAGINANQLVVYRDAAGENAIFVLTDIGLWIYDFTNTRFLQSEIRIPKLPSSQRSIGVVFRDGKLYFSSGAMGVVSVQAGNPFIATPIGLDLEDGVPAEDSGKIAAMAADFNWILALVDATAVIAEEEIDSGLGGPFDVEGWPINSGLLTLRAWNSGWHTLWESPQSSTPGAVLTVSGAYDQRRAYFSSGPSAFYMQLPTSVHNPRNNPTQEYAAGPVSHITPWFDLGTEGQSKQAGHFFMRTKDCTSTEKVTVYYGTDLDDNTWTLLGEITTDGLQRLKPGGPLGVKATFIRFRLDLQRGSTVTATPIVEYWVAEFMRLLPATYGFAFDVNLYDAYKGKSPAQLLQILKQLADPSVTPNLIEFAYQDDLDAEPQTYYVRIMRLQGVEEPGHDLRGQGSYTISVVAPYPVDTI